MRDILDEVLDAYGGRTRWVRATAVVAHQRLGGGLWALKGVPEAAGNGEMTVWLKDQRASVRPFGGSDFKSVYCPERVSIETVDGDLIEILAHPRLSFGGHGLQSPWTVLQAAYFIGYSLWTYVAEPLSLTMSGVKLRQDGTWREGTHTWRRLRVHYPAGIDTHSVWQTLYIDDNGLIRRRDYDVDIAGAAPAVHYLSDFREVEGLVVPATRLIYLRDGAGRPIHDRPMVSIELSDIRVR
jgi:hypothetical protein